MRKIAYTSIVFLVLACSFAGVVFVIESTYLMDAGKTSIIHIFPNHDDLPEDDFAVSVANIDTNKKLVDMVDRLINKKDIFTGIDSIDGIQSLSKKEKKILSFRLAQEFYLRHEYKNVIQSIENLSIKERIQNNTQFMYAYSLSKSHHIYDAIDQYAFLVRHNNNSQGATINLALLLKKSNQCDRAIPYFLKASAISSGRKKAKSLAGLATCYHKMKKYEKAITHFKKSIEYRPNASVVWGMLANSMLETKRPYETVLDAYNKSIALDPK
ncbi:MAG: tetratricopeptide repeat protein [Pseudomonadales bacterium]|nr:tetratricopeptide repeat protein [Pseudomonadales bacterium]